MRLRKMIQTLQAYVRVSACLYGPHNAKIYMGVIYRVLFIVEENKGECNLFRNLILEYKCRTF